MSRTVRTVLVLAAAFAAAVVPARAGAEAETVTTTETVPLEFIFGNTCTGGEPILYEGELHVVFHTTIDDTGSLHLKTQSSGHLTGTGSETGTTYHAVIVRGYTFNQLEFPGPATITTVDVVQFIGSGPLNNELTHIVSHGTFDANGVPHAGFERVMFRCAEDGPA